MKIVSLKKRDLIFMITSLYYEIFKKYIQILFYYFFKTDLLKIELIN